MGHSYVDFREKHALFYDGDLSFIMGSLIKQHGFSIEKDPSYGNLNAFVQWCLNASSNPGPGCIDLKLDDFLQEDHQIQLLLILIDTINNELNSLDDMLTPDYLNQNSINSILYVGSVSKNRFISTIEKFRAVVSGSKDPNART